VHFLLRHHGFGSSAFLPLLIPYGVDVGRVFIEGAVVVCNRTFGLRARVGVVPFDMEVQDEEGVYI